MTKKLPSTEQFEKALNEMPKEKRDEIINTMFRESEEAENGPDFDIIREGIVMDKVYLVTDSWSESYGGGMSVIGVFSSIELAEKYLKDNEGSYDKTHITQISLDNPKGDISNYDGYPDFYYTE